MRRIARVHRAITVQAEVLAEIEEAVPVFLDSNPVLALMAADTVIFENYRSPAGCLAWLTAGLRGWLRANERFNELSGASVFYRYVVLPFPGVVRNWPQRVDIIDIILLHLHLQLWHGVVCGVVFADPRRVSVTEVVDNLNFLALPAHQVFFDVPGFYRSDVLKNTLLEGGRAEQRFAQVRDFVAKHQKNLLWLHYDEENFGGDRLTGWRWTTLREFFRKLYGPQLFCALCHAPIGSFHLDHIAPVSRRYFQTLINFQPLCPTCNRKKRDLEGRDPYTIKLMLPEDLRTRDLDDLVRQPPAWVGRITRPGSKRDLLSKDLGLR